MPLWRFIGKEFIWYNTNPESTNSDFFLETEVIFILMCCKCIPTHFCEKKIRVRRCRIRLGIWWTDYRLEYIWSQLLALSQRWSKTCKTEIITSPTLQKLVERCEISILDLNFFRFIRIKLKTQKLKVSSILVFSFIF